MPSTGIPSLDVILGGRGFPERSAILVTGPAGIGKEALGYWLSASGAESNDYCLYATRLSMSEVVQDQKAFGVVSKKSPIWFARSGGQEELDITDLPALTLRFKELMAKSQGRRTRVVLDILSPLLMLNKAEVAYKFVDALLAEAKQHDAILLATLEDGMHPPQTLAAMEQLFDGVIEFSFHKSGLRILSLLRVVKMRGLTPSQEYHALSFAHSGMTLVKVGLDAYEGANLGPSSVDLAPNLVTTESRAVFEYLMKSFVDDYMKNKMPIEQSGWRTRVAIAEATRMPAESFYGKEGKFGPALKELLSSGLVEMRFFSGQRGRGGEVTKLRVAYEKGHVKRLVDVAVREVGSPKW